jgi:hypothetical protein
MSCPDVEPYEHVDFTLRRFLRAVLDRSMRSGPSTTVELWGRTSTSALRGSMHAA